MSMMIINSEYGYTIKYRQYAINISSMQCQYIINDKQYTVNVSHLLIDGVKGIALQAAQKLSKCLHTDGARS